MMRHFLLLYGLLHLCAICDSHLFKAKWCSWLPWSDCNVKCGSGYRNRSRSCQCPPPKKVFFVFKRAPCKGASNQTEPCSGGIPVCSPQRNESIYTILIVCIVSVVVICVLVATVKVLIPNILKKINSGRQSRGQPALHICGNLCLHHEEYSDDEPENELCVQPQTQLQPSAPPSSSLTVTASSCSLPDSAPPSYEQVMRQISEEAVPVPPPPPAYKFAADV